MLIKDIKKSMVYTALSICTCKANSLYTNMSKIYTHQYLLLINELSITLPKLFTTKINSCA